MITKLEKIIKLYSDMLSIIKKYQEEIDKKDKIIENLIDNIQQIT